MAQKTHFTEFIIVSVSKALRFSGQRLQRLHLLERVIQQLQGSDVALIHN